MSVLNTIVLTKSVETVNNEESTRELSKDEYKWKIVWRNVIVISYFYVAVIYGAYLLPSVKFWSILWIIALFVAAILGITAGAHRLWTHRTYKAKWPLRVLLMLFQTSAGQNHLYDWARNHRLHHKFCDTDADPYNSKRGFFFSHVGWILMRKHPSVIAKGATIDCTDLDNDPIIMFQKKWYLLLLLLFCYILPALVPWLFWDENLWYSWSMGIFAHTVQLNSIMLVNSVGHMWGARPYDESISPVNNIGVYLVTLGEGWHNYHHSFPWDYKSKPFGDMSLTTTFINFFAYFGLAYDLKTVSPEIVRKRLQRKNM